MRVITRATLSNVEGLEQLQRFVSQDIQAIVGVVNGRLSLTDNLQTSLVTVTFTGTSTVQVPHTLGIVPTGYIPVKLSADIRVFDGVGENTRQDIYLKASGAGTATLLIF